MKKAKKKTKKRVEPDSSQSVSPRTKYTTKRSKHTNKTTGETKVLRDGKGRLLPGGLSINPGGRKKGDSFMDEFKQAMKEVEKSKRKSLLKHFVEKAYDDNRILVACIDRILPALKAVEISGGMDVMDMESAQKIQEELRKRFSKA